MNVPNNGIRIVKTTYMEIMSFFSLFGFALVVIDSHNKTTATVQSTKNNPVAIYECAK